MADRSTTIAGILFAAATLAMSGLCVIGAYYRWQAMGSAQPNLASQYAVGMVIMLVVAVAIPVINYKIWRYLISRLK